MSKRKFQHLAWLETDKRALCGNDILPRQAITPHQWFPRNEADCPVCWRTVLAHFNRQDCLAEFEKLGGHLPSKPS